jgi:quercetin dioxygenase-like cupin family protein
MHVHTHGNIHITVVSRGSVKVHGPSIEPTVYSAGAVIDFEEGHPHEFIAEEDDSRIVNIVKWIQNENK